MTDSSALFSDDWTHRLSQASGGLDIDELDDRVSQALREEDVAAGAPGEAWKIGAYVDEGTYEEINAYARGEIAAGAEALLFRLYRQPDAEDIATILDNIDAANVGLHCSLRYPGQDPAELFRDLVTYLRGRQYDLSRIRGSVDFDPLLDWSDPPFPPLIRLLKFVCRWMPSFAVLQVNAAGFNNGAHSADTELALALAKGMEYLKEVEDHGYSPATACDHLKFALTVGLSFHGDVAKLRALRRLWPKALATIGVKTDKPVRIAAHSDVNALSDSWQRNRHALRLQATAAALGRASVIYLTPLEDIDDTPTIRARQYALDTQQVLRRGIPAVVKENDLEVITDTLVAATWGKYQNLVAQGGFATATEF